jgi:HPt (histidine-containing phosphotransfer) domain-containing protein
MSLSPVIYFPPLLESPTTTFALSAADLEDLLNTPPIDHRLLLENCLGKPTFAISLLEEFGRTAAGRLAEFEDQLRQGNLAAIAALSHALRGVVDILCASTLRTITVDIEAACHAADHMQVQQWIQQLRNEVQRMQQQIPELCTMLQRPDADKV